MSYRLNKRVNWRISPRGTYQFDVEIRDLSKIVAVVNRTFAKAGCGVDVIERYMKINDSYYTVKADIVQRYIWIGQIDKSDYEHYISQMKEYYDETY